VKNGLKRGFIKVVYRIPSLQNPVKGVRFWGQVHEILTGTDVNLGSEGVKKDPKIRCPGVKKDPKKGRKGSKMTPKERFFITV
jgi:hypothetical protein